MFKLLFLNDIFQLFDLSSISSWHNTTYSEPLLEPPHPLSTQWAAVRTYLSPINDPPHSHFPRPVSPAYPNNASQGYVPIGASEPPTILVHGLGGQSLRLVTYLRLGWILNLKIRCWINHTDLSYYFIYHIYIPRYI